MIEKKTTFQQYAETDTLAVTFIGRVEGYRKNEAYTEIVNHSQKSGLPEVEELKREFEGFANTLKNNGVEVWIPDYVGEFVYDQLTPRDIAVVIANRLVLCNMVKRSRRYEVAGIFSQIARFAGEGVQVLVPPADAFLEGGDIVVDGDHIFIGISQRSNMKGYAWLESVFGNEFEVVALHTKSPSEQEDVLHLDCAFNPLQDGLALIYPEGFREIPDVVREKYAWIEVEKKEQEALATNVLSLSKNRVVSRDHPDCRRVNAAMRDRGIEVLEIPFNAAPATGGSVRCCSLPLVRTRTDG